SPLNRGNTILTPRRRARGPSTASTTRAMPSQTNIICQSRASTARSATSASTAPVAVRRCTEAAPRRAIICCRLLEAALDLAENGHVPILILEGRTALLQVQLRLPVAIEKLEPEIELRHDRITEHFQPAALGLRIDHRGAGSGKLERRCVGLRSGSGRIWRRRRLLLKGKRRA